jgi:hypothetical protein
MFKNFNFFIIGANFYVAYPGSASASGIRIWNADSGCGSRRPKSCGSMRMRMRIRTLISIPLLPLFFCSVASRGLSGRAREHCPTLGGDVGQDGVRAAPTSPRSACQT